jgi:hypothetical protein
MEDLRIKYGTSDSDRQKVTSFFEGTISGARVANYGDFVTVSATVSAIEIGLGTSLRWFSHEHISHEKKKKYQKRFIRSIVPIEVADDVQDVISFISLNAPINSISPRGVRGIDVNQLQAEITVPYNSVVKISPGNEEALIVFPVFCGDGSLNVYNPPCAGLDAAYFPTVFDVTVSGYAYNGTGNPVQLDTDPLTFTISPTKVSCYNTFTAKSCSGIDGFNCTCTTKVLVTIIFSVSFHRILGLSFSPALAAAQVHSAESECHDCLRRGYFSVSFEIGGIQIVRPH